MFIFILNEIKKKVMGLLDQVNKNKIIENSNEVKVSLTKQELEVILGTLKNSNFKGEVVEVLYNLVLKMQNSYLSFPPENDK